MITAGQVIAAPSWWLILVIVAAMVVINIGLFIGSLIFLASGQTFEQFSGIE